MPSSSGRPSSARTVSSPDSARRIAATSRCSGLTASRPSSQRRMPRRQTSAPEAVRRSVFASRDSDSSIGSRVKRRSSQPFTGVWSPWQRAHAAAFGIGWMTAYSSSFPFGDCTTVVLSNRCRSRPRHRAHERRRGGDGHVAVRRDEARREELLVVREERPEQRRHRVRLAREHGVRHAGRHHLGEELRRARAARARCPSRTGERRRRPSPPSSGRTGAPSGAGCAPGCSSRAA